MPDLSTIKAIGALALLAGVLWLVIRYARGGWGADLHPHPELVDRVPENSTGSDFFTPVATHKAMARDWQAFISAEIWARGMRHVAEAIAYEVMFAGMPVGRDREAIASTLRLMRQADEQDFGKRRALLSEMARPWPLPNLGNGPKAGRHSHRRDSPMRVLCFFLAASFGVSAAFFGYIASGYLSVEPPPGAMGLAPALAVAFASALCCGVFIACGILAEMNNRGRS